MPSHEDEHRQRDNSHSRKSSDFARGRLGRGLGDVGEARREGEIEADRRRILGGMGHHARHERAGPLVQQSKQETELEQREKAHRVLVEEREDERSQQHALAAKGSRRPEALLHHPTEEKLLAERRGEDCAPGEKPQLRWPELLEETGGVRQVPQPLGRDVLAEEGERQSQAEVVRHRERAGEKYRR